MQVLPQMYVHDGMATSYEPGLLVQPNGVVHRGLPVLGVHPYFTECHDAHQIVVSLLPEISDTLQISGFRIYRVESLNSTQLNST